MIAKPKHSIFQTLQIHPVWLRNSFLTGLKIANWQLNVWPRVGANSPFHKILDVRLVLILQFWKAYNGLFQTAFEKIFYFDAGHWFLVFEIKFSHSYLQVSKVPKAGRFEIENVEQYKFVLLQN